MPGRIFLTYKRLGGGNASCHPQMVKDWYSELSVSDRKSLSLDSAVGGCKGSCTSNHFPLNEEKKYEYQKGKENIGLYLL